MKIMNIIYYQAFILISFLNFVYSYSGYQVLRTVPLKDEADLIKLKPLMANPEYDFWTTPRVGQSTDIMTSPEYVGKLWNELTRLGLKPSVVVSDVGSVLARERSEMELRMMESTASENRGPDLTRFLTLTEINDYIDQVVASYPTIASLIDIGLSYENRALRVLKVSNGENKQGMFLDAAIHARNWMGVPVVLHTINQLTENLTMNQAMLDRNDFYFLPVANPDGYEFSWSSDNARLWRKTRSINAESSCIGADANKNYNFHWGEGGVISPCDDNYPGSAPFSESEAKAIADFLANYTEITMYLSMDNYGQHLAYPWGYSYDMHPNSIGLDSSARNATLALANVQGTVYNVGSIYNIIYQTFGCNVDYMTNNLSLIYSYTMDLPAGGTFGFNPPPEDIVPVTTETWEAIKVLAEDIPETRG